MFTLRYVHKVFFKAPFSVESFIVFPCSQGEFWLEPNLYIEKIRKTLLVLKWSNQRAFRLSKTKFVCI